jgi:integrase/recombinase XerD
MDDNITLLELFDEFVQAKRAERRRERTLKGYGRHIRYLNQWLTGNGLSTVAREISRKDIREFVNWMSYGKLQYGDHPYRPKSNEEHGLSPTTFNIRMRSIKAVLNWAEQEGYIPKSPVRGMKPQPED